MRFLVVACIVRSVSYSVLFREFPVEHIDVLAPVIRQVYEITDFDARTKIRKGWGFLEREVTEEEARRIVEGIGDVAGGAAAVENAQLRTPAEPKVVIGFEPGEHGVTLQLQSPQDPPRLVKWPEMRVVAAGRFSEEIIVRE